MERKTRRFGTISDSAKRSKSCRRFFEIHFRCRESSTLFPYKTLILTPPAKIVNNSLPLKFCWQFFCIRVPDIISKLNQKICQSEQDVDQVLYFSINSQQCQNKYHGFTAPKKLCKVFLCSLHIKSKKRARRGSVLEDTCGLTEQNEISTHLYDMK